LGFLVLVPASPAQARAQDVAGVVTELKRGHGVVEVKPAGTSEWRSVGPLLALRAGDALQATADAIVVVLLGGGRGSVRIDAASSPFSVPELPAEDGLARKGATLLQRSLGALSTTRSDPTYVKLGTRAARRPPVVLSPRNGLILPGEIRIEWSGIPERRYAVTVLDAGGDRVEQVSVQGPALTLSTVAPVLSPGIRYRVQVATGNLRPEEAWFEILDATRSMAVRQDLAEVEQTAGPDVSMSTLAALKAVVLADQDLLSDARQVVLSALKSDPDEASLHLLLGNLYRRMGLAEQAAESFEEAALLSTGKRR
jgi:hypothetical protein